MVLGKNEVAVEFKLEPDYPNMAKSLKPVVLREEVYKDISRISEYRDKGFKQAYFVLLDEDGQHKRNLKVDATWRSLHYGNGESYLLVVNKSKYKLMQRH